MVSAVEMITSAILIITRVSHENSLERCCLVTYLLKYLRPWCLEKPCIKTKQDYKQGL